MSRKIKKRAWQIPKAPEIPDTGFDTVDALKSWLLTQAQAYHLETLLLQADDRLTWGRVDGAGLHLASDHFKALYPAPDLDLKILQECRLFGERAELYLWRNEENGWAARLIEDGPGTAGETLDEWQILWGTEALAEENGFTLVNDGAQGNRHAPPLTLDKIPFGPQGEYRPLRLQVRHYLTTDIEQQAHTQTGLAYIHLSRLVKVEGVPKPPPKTLTTEETDELA